MTSLATCSAVRSERRGRLVAHQLRVSPASRCTRVSPTHTMGSGDAEWRHAPCVYDLVGLGEILAPLGWPRMTYGRPGLQHGRGHLPGIGAGIHRMQFSAPTSILVPLAGSGRTEAGIRRACRPPRPGGILTGGSAPRPSSAPRGGFIHLPVAGDNRFTHGRNLLKISRQAQQLPAPAESGESGICPPR